MTERGVLVGPDGLARCSWALSAPDYLPYHDTEWGRPLHGDDQLYERMTLESFQSGLSWLTILRKRDNFRVAFDRFSIAAVAGYQQPDVDRLLADTGIVRNRAKIEAAIANARATLELPGGLSPLLWSFAPAPARGTPRGPPCSRRACSPRCCGRSRRTRRRARGRGRSPTCRRPRRSRPRWPGTCAGAASASSAPPRRTR